MRCLNQWTRHFTGNKMKYPIRNLMFEKIRQAGTMTDADLMKDLAKDGVTLADSDFNKTLLDLVIYSLVRGSLVTNEQREHRDPRACVRFPCPYRKAPKVGWRPHEDQPAHHETQKVDRAGCSCPAGHRRCAPSKTTDNDVRSVAALEPCCVDYDEKEYA